MVDPQARLRHILLLRPPASMPYTHPAGGGGSGPPDLVERERESHGAFLRQQYDVVAQGRAELDSRRRRSALPEDLADCISFRLRKTKDLNVQSLEAVHRDVRLLSVVERGEDLLVRASVRVPHGKLHLMTNKVDAYLDPAKDSARHSLPRGAVLHNSIEAIERATLSSVWTDALSATPPQVETPVAWEVCCVGDSSFREHASTLGLDVGAETLRFPEREVFLVRASTAALAEAVELLDSVAEVRLARSLDPRSFMGLPQAEQHEWVEELSGRSQAPGANDPAICLLDTGIDGGHPLLEGSLGITDSYDPSWGPQDDHGHGTQMSGLIVFGNKLDKLLESTQSHAGTHGIESVKMVQSGHSAVHDPKLYGEVMLECAARAESAAPSRSRAFVSAVTASDSPLGKPTSWSAAVDSLAAGDREGDQPARLVLNAVGNCDLSTGYVYPDSNFDSPVQDPAQAWNALSVGAMTNLATVDVTQNPGCVALAAAGDLSPASTTAASWPAGSSSRRPPIKPEVLVEGGNWALRGNTPDALDELSLLTTRLRRPGQGLLALTGDTSAAAAVTASVAGELMARYPSLWPEAVRGLLVHSARWTPTMVARFGGVLNRASATQLCRHYGYGALDPERAAHSRRNAPTLVIQQELQPYFFKQDAKGQKKPATNELHLFRLPWPSDELERLGETEVSLRVTLSYFIEPGPGEVGWGDRYRYPSFTLRFRVSTPNETEELFRHRINREDRDPRLKTESDASDWLLGSACEVGSVHSDVWVGTAASLATKALIAVYPTGGWWRYRKHLGRVEQRARYALILSLEVPSEAATIDGTVIEPDIYSPIEQQVDVVSV